MDGGQLLPRRSRGPEIVAELFKGLALVVLALGLVAAIVTGAVLSQVSDIATKTAVEIACGIVIGSVVSAASLAFFGYGLELLVQMRDNSDVLAELALTEDHEPAVAR